MTAESATVRTLLSPKFVYPALAVGLLGIVVGLQYCPALARVAPDFSLPLIASDGRANGDRMRLGDQRGKVVVVDFWATWCGPCQRSTPGLERVWRRYRDRGLVVMGINVDENGTDAVPGFVRHFGIDYPVLYDDGSAQTSYGIHALPTVVFIDRQGRIRQVHTGESTEEDLASQIEGLL